MPGKRQNIVLLTPICKAVGLETLFCMLDAGNWDTESAGLTRRAG